MSLIMRLASPNEVPGAATDAALDALLDHIARELASEYVRLMEQAAGRRDSTSADCPPITGSDQ